MPTIKELIGRLTARPPKPDIKLCIDCKWCRFRNYTGSHECFHPELVTIDPVDGVIRNADCNEQRRKKTGRGHFMPTCWKDGYYWEAKT